MRRFRISLLIFFALSTLGAEYRFYHPDALGSNVVVTDRSGNVVQRMVYAPYGDLRKVINGEGQSIAASADDVRHRFTGQEFDPESGLHYLGARSYDSFVGRFMSSDPIWINGDHTKALTALSDNPAILNTHAYTFNRPTVFVDPGGEFASLVARILMGIAAAASNPALTAHVATEAADGFESFMQSGEATLENPSAENLSAFVGTGVLAAAGTIGGPAGKAGTKLLMKGAAKTILLGPAVTRKTDDVAGALVAAIKKAGGTGEVKPMLRAVQDLAEKGPDGMSGRIKSLTSVPGIFELKPGKKSSSRALFFFGKDGEAVIGRVVRHVDIENMRSVKTAKPVGELRREFLGLP